MEPTQDPQNTNSPTSESQPTLDPIRVGAKDESGAVIVRPEDVYGKVLPKDDSAEPKPFSEVVEEKGLEAPEVQTPRIVPNFPQTQSQAAQNNYSTGAAFFSNSQPESPTDSKSKFGDKSLLGIGGSDAESHINKEGGLTFLKVFLAFGLIILLAFSLLAFEFYLASKNSSMLQKYMGINLFELFIR